MTIKHVVVLSALFAVGCVEHREPGPAERAGARVDEIVDNAEEGKPLLHKQGPAESLGESLDQAAENAKHSLQ